uniref:Secreted protein n=1 Tax=Picea glauca TaxID=3330 RepID=A0A101M334_PICGL|nr:hypothetical protein ABT39_MTgene3220 [Picea glauca]QHR90590.1 hypothetical protein Q903MT_gene4615 [Picea sitchensis]
MNHRILIGFCSFLWTQSTSRLVRTSGRGNPLPLVRLNLPTLLNLHTTGPLMNSSPQTLRNRSPGHARLP